jgi:hypothetical protein
MLPLWKDRPEITANLFNPAFCGSLLYECFKGFKEESNNNFPFALSFFTLPVVMHKTTRNAIPSTSRNSLHSLIEENDSLKINLADRVKHYKPFTQEAISFLILHDTIKIATDGTIEILKLKNYPNDNKLNEAYICLKKSKTFGKILAKSGSPYTIYTILGLKP